MPPRPAKKQQKTTSTSLTSTLTPTQLSELESKKSESIDTLRSQMIFQAWSITKSPGSKRMVLPGSSSKKRKLACPRSYRSKEYDLIDVRPGDDLNAAISLYYNERMTPQVQEEAVKRDKEQIRKKAMTNDSEMEGWSIGGGFGINYVAGEGVIQKRHEHLGPAPMVAGYQYLNSADHDIRILWYDVFLQDRWCEKDSWDISVGLSVNTKGEGEWVVAQT